LPIIDPRPLVLVRHGGKFTGEHRRQFSCVVRSDPDNGPPEKNPQQTHLSRCSAIESTA